MPELKYANDIEVDAVYSLGAHEMLRAEGEAFTAQGDPGAMRAEDGSARRPEGDQPIASGMHSIAVHEAVVPRRPT